MLFSFYFVCTLIIQICSPLDVHSCELDTAVQRKPPGLHARKKVWWAKEITPDFHIAGRLTSRQIKYTAEAGFKSVLSLYTYDDAGSFGGEHLPTSAEAWVASHQAGLQYIALLGPWDNDASVEAVHKFSDALTHLKRPILLHCNRGYSITFVTLMYMANQSRYDPTYEPKINSERFYRIAASMGLDFTADDMRQVVSNITGEPVVDNPPKPDCEPKEWRDFWLAHPVYRNWYTAGQIRKTNIKVLEDTGFKAIVNMRMGVTDNGIPSQEAVTLLNIKDGTSTYGDGLIGPRQNDEILKTLRLDPNKSNDYVSEKSKVNYESRNPGEFGDDIGYNETLERLAVEASSLKYYHLPFSSDGKFSADAFSLMKDKLLEAGQQGPVLLHCASATRVAYVGVLAAALQHNKDFSWALKRIRELGFEVGPDKDMDVYEMYKVWLNPEDDWNSTKNEL
ncbi:hypothetical protein ACJMK2_016370 [Sinanodonta woodiana]|uniref:Tyrosine specific protein phosphatases domain-containing protein n=1 Tax=Sinanodonta woodiana TaxID=1069815 RepID=A0ABD3UX07_SINWO